MEDKKKYWHRTEWSSEPKQEREALATLIISDDQDEIKILGNAFIISSHGAGAICLGAAHSFESVKQIQNLRSPFSNINVPPDFQPKGPHYFSPEDIHVLFIRDDQPIICKIEYFNYIANHDIVAFTAVAPEKKKIFNSHMAIDLSVPMVGDDIAVLANDIEFLEKRLGGAKIKQNLVTHLGKVTEVCMHDKGTLGGLSFYFRTTIPVAGGMSGAPVIAMPSEGKKVIVKGVVSADFSVDEAFISCEVSGNSAASMLWPAMGLAMRVIDSGVDKTICLGDLVEKKVFDVQNDGAKVRVERKLEMVDVLYTDERTKPRTKVRLSMSKHPELE